MEPLNTAGFSSGADSLIIIVACLFIFVLFNCIKLVDKPKRNSSEELV